MSKDLFKPHNNDTKEFSLHGKGTFARVTSIHDGDTLTCIIPLFDNFYKFNTRLDGIDTCEILSDNPITKQIAVQARNRLIDLVTRGMSLKIDKDLLNQRKFVQGLLDKDVYLIWIDCGNFDKYGRLLVKAKLDHDDTQTLSQILITENLAYSYQGGTKLTESQQANKLTPL